MSGRHIPRKRFGQHFLADGAIIDGIVAAIAPRPGQFVIEIGPGLAALTQPLVERLGHLTVIELDRDLAARLRSAQAAVRAELQDVLKKLVRNLLGGCRLDLHADLQLAGNLASALALEGVRERRMAQRLEEAKVRVGHHAEPVEARVVDVGATR